MPNPSFVSSQLHAKIPVPTKKWTGQTIIVTGSNVGMGLEAARYFVRLDAAKVILAVRNLSKGEAAKASIEASEKRLNVVEVWELDLARYASVEAFAARAQILERLDVVIENAGIYTFEFNQAEENEATITVNVVSTFLLALLLIPKLRETAVKFEKVPVLSFTGSFVHFDTKFPERKEANIFGGLAKEKGARMNDRYNVSKMIELLCSRELANEVTKSSKQRIIVSLINPGFIKTQIMRETTGLLKVYVKVMQKTLSRPAEVGGRILVSAAEGGDETHGQYLDDCKPGKVSDFVTSKDGVKTQKKLWTELSEKLEKIQPGIMSAI